MLIVGGLVLALLSLILGWWVGTRHERVRWTSVGKLPGRVKVGEHETHWVCRAEDRGARLRLIDSVERQLDAEEDVSCNERLRKSWEKYA